MEKTLQPPTRGDGGRVGHIDAGYLRCEVKDLEEEDLFVFLSVFHSVGESLVVKMRNRKTHRTKPGTGTGTTRIVMETNNMLGLFRGSGGMFGPSSFNAELLPKGTHN